MVSGRSKRPLPLVSGYILKKIVHGSIEYGALGDFSEKYNTICSVRNIMVANIWVWFQIFQMLPKSAVDAFYRSTAMIKNYLKIAFRNIRRNKGYSFINISGLSVGMVCFTLIFLYVRHEMSYDKFHENAENIYRIVIDSDPGGSSSSKVVSTYPALAQALKRDFTEVVKATKIKKEACVITCEEAGFNENNVYYVEQDFLEMFSFPLVSGDNNTALREPNSVLFTREMAEKYFGDKNPLGKTVTISTWPYRNKFSYKITGILNDVPENSHLDFDFLVSYSSYYSIYRNGRSHMEEAWDYFDPKTYVMLESDFDPRIIEERFQIFLEKYKSKDSISDNKYILQPVGEINLRGNYGYELESNNDITSIYLLSAIAVLIILIASFNYMNLSAARSVKRSKEIGIRKIAGARKIQLIRQFLGESLLFSFLALIVSAVLVKLSMPFFNRIMEKNISLGISDTNPLFLYLGGVTVIVGLISGLYPAMFLSSFRPVNILKGTGGRVSGGSSGLKNSLVVFQFIISVTLIISTLIIRDQLLFLKNKDLGYDKDQIITIHSMDSGLNGNYEPFFNELSNHSSIKSVSAGLDIPTTIRRRAGIRRSSQSGDESSGTYYTFVDHDYLDLYGMEFLKGRNFSRDFPSDIGNAVIINESAAENLGWKEPIGRKLTFQGQDWTIIGIVKDFHYRPLYQEIIPLTIILHHDYSVVEYFSIKISTDDISGTIDYIENKWRKFSPGYPFEFSFLDEKIDAVYRNEQKMGRSFNYLTLIATFIACLGLFGLASFTVEQKRKEVGIRKVLGSSVPGVVSLISREFLTLVLFANIAAWPLSWYFMDRWLQQFAYRTEMDISVFIISGSAALIIAVFAVSYQSIKAALINPVESIKYE